MSLKGNAKGGQKLDALRDAGGIIPDFWVNGRTYSDFYQGLYQSGSFDDIARKLLDDPRSQVQAYKGSIDRFISDYSEEDRFEALVMKTCKVKKIVFDRANFIRDRKYIAQAVKLRIAHQLFGAEGQIRFFVRSVDPVVRIAEKVPVSQP